MKRANIIISVALLLLMTSCLTASKQPVSEGPFQSDISDTINRLSGKLPDLVGGSGRTQEGPGNRKAIHIRRTFKNYSTKREEKRDIAAERTEILTACCSNQRIRNSLEKGISLHFDYYGKNGLFVATTVVNKNACKNQALALAYGKVTNRDGVYLVYSSGIVKDTKNNLEWFAGPDKNVTWYEADRWVRGLDIAGGGWRMPTLKELEGLYRKGAGSRNMTPLIKTSGWWVWSGETVGTKEARSFSFGHGFKGWIFKGNSANERVFAVRSRAN